MGEKKVIVVTGANSGIGKVTALELAKEGHQVVMVCRDKVRGEQALLEVKKESKNTNVHLLLCDLSSFASVRTFAKEFKMRFKTCDVLINNAGVMFQDRQMTEDGFEMHFQVNYLSPFLLTQLLLECMNEKARIINVSSLAHRMGKINFKDLNLTKRFSMFKAYSQSKLALVLFTYELSRRLTDRSITVNCLHPGVIISNLGIYKNRKVIDYLTNKLRKCFTSTSKGAETTIFLASSTNVEHVTGKYFYHKKIRKSSRTSYNQSLAQKLWNYTLDLFNNLDKNNQQSA